MINNLFKKLNERYHSIFFIVLAICTLLALSFCIPRGLIFGDEGFFMHNLNHPELFLNFGSDWLGLTKSWYPRNLLLIRSLTVFLMLCSVFIFSKGLSSFLKLSFIIVLASSAVFSFCFYSPVNINNHYVFLNFIVITTSLGFMFLGFKTYFFTVVSGLVISFLPIVMVTNSPLIIVMFCYLFMVQKKDFYNIKTNMSFLFLIGFLIGCLLIFLFYKSPICIMDEYRLSMIINANDKTHGIWEIFQWIKTTLIYYLFCVLIPAYVLWILKKKFNYSVFVVCFVVFALCTYYFGVYENHYNINHPTLILVFCFVGLIDSFIKNNKRDFLTGLLLVLCCFFASLGTDVKFWIRSSVYLVFIGAFTYYISKVKERYLLLIFGVFPQVLIYMFLYTNSPGWQNYNLSEQKIELDFIKETRGIFIDKERYFMLEKFNTLISKKDLVLSNSKKLWGVIYALNLKTNQRTYGFNQKNSRIDDLLKLKKFKRIVFIEDNLNTPFKKEYTDELRSSKVDTLGFVSNRYLVLALYTNK